jgi:GT2 family glycosyltransferase
MAKISLCIPACGRPSRLKELLASLEGDADLLAETIVINATPGTAKAEVHAAYRELAEVKRFSTIQAPWAGPAEARANGARLTKADSEYVLFLDEDLRSRPGGLGKMLSFLDANPDVACCSAQWIDHRGSEPPKRRPLGYVYVESVSGSPPTLYKHAVHTSGAGYPPFILHDLQASVLIRKPVLEVCNFDPKFDFFLELFDFFYALHKGGFRCAGLPEVVFDHFPGEYRSGSQKRDADVKKLAAHDYFINKWGIAPGLLRKGGANE